MQEQTRHLEDLQDPSIPQTVKDRVLSTNAKNDFKSPETKALVLKMELEIEKTVNDLVQKIVALSEEDLTAKGAEMMLDCLIQLKSILNMGKARQDFDRAVRSSSVSRIGDQEYDFWRRACDELIQYLSQSMDETSARPLDEKQGVRHQYAQAAGLEIKGLSLPLLENMARDREQVLYPRLVDFLFASRIRDDNIFGRMRRYR